MSRYVRGAVGQSRAGQSRAGQGRAGQGRAEQGRAEQSRAGQGRAEQGRAGLCVTGCAYGTMAKVQEEALAIKEIWLPFKKSKPYVCFGREFGDTTWNRRRIRRFL